jgi:4-carboxymuconolactone decarboxylase
MDDEVKRKTQETAGKLFGKRIKMDPLYRLGKGFDEDLANDLSMLITCNLEK